MTADEITDPPAAIVAVAPRQRLGAVSPDVLAAVVTALTGRITTLEGIVDDLVGTVEKMKAERAGTTKVLGQAVLELVKADEIKAAVASSIKWVGAAVAIAIVAMTGVQVMYGDLQIGGGTQPDAVNAERVESIAEPVTLPPEPGASPDLGTSPDP